MWKRTRHKSCTTDTLCELQPRVPLLVLAHCTLHQISSKNIRFLVSVEGCVLENEKSKLPWSKKSSVRILFTWSIRLTCLVLLATSTSKCWPKPQELRASKAGMFWLHASAFERVSLIYRQYEIWCDCTKRMLEVMSRIPSTWHIYNKL